MSEGLGRRDCDCFPQAQTRSLEPGWDVQGMLILRTGEGGCLSGRVWGPWGPLIWATVLAHNGNAGTGETLYSGAWLCRWRGRLRKLILLVSSLNGGNCWELPTFQIVPWKRRACPGLC